MPKTPDQAADDLTRMLASGLDLYVHAHGPDGSGVVRDPDGRAHVDGVSLGGVVSYADHGGERFAVYVVPLAQPGSLLRRLLASLL